MRLTLIAGTLLTLLVLVLLVALACLRFGMCTGITGIASNTISAAPTVPMGLIVLSVLAISSGLAVGFLLMRPHAQAKKILKTSKAYKLEPRATKFAKPFRLKMPIFGIPAAPRPKPTKAFKLETRVPKLPQQKITKPFKFKLFTLKKKKLAKPVIIARVPKAPRPLKVPAVPKFTIEEIPVPTPILRPRPAVVAVPKQISQIQQRLEMVRLQMESRSKVERPAEPRIAHVPSRIIRTLPPITKITQMEEAPAPAERPASPVNPALARLQERITAIRHEVALPPVETRPKFIEDLEKIANVRHEHHIIKRLWEKKKVKKVSREALEDIERKLGKL